MNFIRNYKDNTKHLNNRTFTDYYYRLMLLARSVFEWKNLPNNINEKWIEKFLFFEGACVFFKSDELGFMVSKFADSSHLNHYDEPTEVLPVFTNYTLTNVHSLKNGSECVIIRNNDAMTPTNPTIELFAHRLTDLQRTIDININAMKTPVLIKCTDKQKLSLKQTFNQWNGFEPVIFGDKNLDTEGITALNIEAPPIFDKLQLQKHALWNECYTFLGINNANQDKRERLVDDEVRANNEQVELSAYLALKARQQACKEINELFGTNISVDLRKNNIVSPNLDNTLDIGGDEIE